jgi:ketosteroid isomerase-like protein
LNAPGSDGAPMSVGGKYIVVWQRGDDGVWRHHPNIWNMNP